MKSCQSKDTPNTEEAYDANDDTGWGFLNGFNERSLTVLFGLSQKD